MATDNTEWLDNQIAYLEAQVEEAGIDPALATPRESMFGKFLDAIDKPKQATQGVLDSLFLRRDIQQLGGGSWTLGLGNAMLRGMDEKANAFDVLRRNGVDNAVARGVLGFAGEILTDPLSYIGVGLGKNAAMAGGRALSKTGQAAKQKKVEEVLSGILEVEPDIGKAWMLADEQVDEAFRGAAQALDLQKSVKSYQDAVVTAGNLSEAKQRASLLDDIEGMVDYEDLFEKSTVKLGIGLPFIGHLEKGKKASRTKDLSNTKIRHQLYSAVSDIVKPGRIEIAEIPVSTLGDWKKHLTGEISKELDIAANYIGGKVGFPNAYKEIKKIAGEVLDFVDETAIATKNSKAGQKVAEIKDEAGTILKRTFFKKLGLGKHVNDRRVDLIGVRAASSNVAWNEVLQKFPEFASKDFSPDILKEAMAEIDRVAVMNSTQAIEVMAKEKSEAAEEMLEMINSVYTGTGDARLPIELSKAFKGLNDVFTENIQIAIAQQRDPDVAQAMTRVVDHFNSLQAEERALGVDTGFLEAYLPHRYANLDKANAGKGYGSSSFTKGRKFNSLTEAIKEQRLQGEIDPLELLLSRTQGSYKTRGSRKYFHRFVVENGMPADEYAKRVQESAFDPAMRETLVRRGYGVPRLVTDEEMEAIRLGAGKELSTVKSVLFGKQQTGKVILDDELELRDQLAAQLARFEDSTEALLYQNGIRPGDIEQPKAFLNENAIKVMDLDGKPWVLPTEVAHAWEDTISGRDFVKEALSGTRLGPKLLELHDSSLNFLKSMTTLPFPNYWGRNLFGDGMFRAIDGGISALDPGYISDLAHLSSNGTVRLRNGQILTPEAWKTSLQRYGVEISNEDFIDIISAAGKLNVEKSVRIDKLKREGITKWAKQTTKDTANSIDSFVKGKGFTGEGLDGMKAASQVMRDKFENTFRAGHVLHHLHNGSSFADAVRRTNEALINYRDLSPIERSLFRRAFFFYNWVSKASKKTLTHMMTHPGALQFQLKSARGVSEFFTDDVMPPSMETLDEDQYRSLTMLEQVSFPLGKDKEGKPIAGRGFGLPLNVLLENFSLYAPRNASVSEVIASLGSSWNRTAEKLLSASNPGLKTLFESIADKNLFFDQPFSKEFLRKVPSFESTAMELAKYPFGQIPASVLMSADKAIMKFLDAVPDGKGNYIADPGRYYLFVNLIPPISRANGLLRDLVDEDLTPGQKLAQTFSGIRVEEQDIGRSVKYKRKEALEQLLEQKSAKHRIEQLNN